MSESHPKVAPESTTAANGSGKREGSGLEKKDAADEHIARAAAYLEDNNMIGFFRTRHKGYPRMVALSLQTMYESLTTLYTTAFIAQWRSLKYGVEASLPDDITGSHAKYAASVYISHWIVDLYVSNREAVRDISLHAYCQHFSYEFAHFSTVYDAFLVHLNSMIRPTLVERIPEESMFIPHFGNDLFTDPANPFNLIGFHINYDCFNCIIHQMEDKKEWVTGTLMSNTTGRAAWLLDWYDNDAYAWFPQESNYSDGDIALAYIVGAALTPPLAPCDTDEWQFFPGGTLPATLNVTSYKRLTDRIMFGAFEMKTLSTREVDPKTFMMSTKRKRVEEAAKDKRPTSSALTIIEGATEGRDDEEEIGIEESLYDPSLSSSSTEATRHKLWQFRISDYLYRRKVIINNDLPTRSTALEMLIHEARK